MKPTENVALDFIEQDILFCWACPSYEVTMIRRTDLGRITEDSDIKEHIEDLIVKLFLHCDQEHFEQLFYQNRLQLEQGIKRKLYFARELMDMELKEVA